MNRNPSPRTRGVGLVIALSCLTAGCFGAHGLEDPPIEDPPIEDPPQWTDCYDALLSARAGESCDFRGECGEGGCDFEDTRTAMCIDGRVRLISRICQPPQWFDCEEFRTSGYGVAGEYCDEALFGSCADPLIDCCGNSYSCDGGVVVTHAFCADGCLDPPLCEDYEPPPAEVPLCASSADCTEETYCRVPGAPEVCGPCFDPLDGCASDGDCGAGSVCISELLPCSCDDGPTSVCRPMCTPGSCEDGFFCNSRGVCMGTDCNDDYVCGPNLRCIGIGLGDGVVDAHGCQRLSCEATNDCECGVCVEGQCHSNLGVCEGPHP